MRIALECLKVFGKGILFIGLFGFNLIKMFTLKQNMTENFWNQKHFIYTIFKIFKLHLLHPLPPPQTLPPLQLWRPGIAGIQTPNHSCCSQPL